jgi:hypothetical protein
LPQLQKLGDQSARFAEVAKSLALNHPAVLEAGPGRVEKRGRSPKDGLEGWS